MTETEARALVVRLFEHFGVPAPTVVWSGRVTTGRYTYGVIRVGPAAWTGVESSVLHEFAHHLSWIRDKVLGHGSGFTNALIEVVGYHYGHPRGYAWHHEYPHLYRMARAMGWTTRPHKEDAHMLAKLRRKGVRAEAISPDLEAILG